MTPLLLAAALSLPCGTPTPDCLSEVTRFRADMWVEAEHQTIDPTWFLSEGWDDPALTPVRTHIRPPAFRVPASGSVTPPSAPPAEVEAAIRATFPEDPETALMVAWCESGFDTAVISRTNDYGLMQINKKAHERGIVAALGYTMEDMRTLGPNLAVARSLYDSSGWGPWYMSRHCHGAR